MRQMKRKGVTKKKKKKLEAQQKIWCKDRINGVMLSDVLDDKPAVPSDFEWTPGQEGPLENNTWSLWMT